MANRKGFIVTLVFVIYEEERYALALPVPSVEDSSANCITPPQRYNSTMYDPEQNGCRKEVTP
jgi:hypothetical protein